MWSHAIGSNRSRKPLAWANLADFSSNERWCKAFGQYNIFVTPNFGLAHQG
jgi:hypothetical protein